MRTRRAIRRKNIVGSRMAGCLPIGCLGLIASAWVLPEVGLAVDRVGDSLRGPNAPLVGGVLGGLVIVVGLVAYQQRYGDARRKAGLQFKIIAVGAGDLAAFVALASEGARSAAIGWAVLVAVAAFMVAFLVGKLGANPPSAVRRAAVFLARHPLSFASSCTAVLLGGILALHERVLIVRPCLGYLDEFSSINVENLAGSDGITKVGDLLRDAESGSSACLAAYIPREAARLANTRDALAQRQAALEEKAKQDREAAEGAARAAALQAKVDAWPSTRVEIEAKINEAATEVKTGEFIGADTALDAAQKMLDDLRGTQVEATESWSTLAKQAQSDRTKIRRQVGRIRKQREAEEKQREAEEEKRNEAFAQEQAVREQRLAAAARSDLRKECSVSHETAAGKTNCEGWFVVCGSEANDGIPYYLSSQGCAVMGSGLAMPFLFGVDVPGHLETERTMSTWCCSKSP